jgi:hypothetical protein
VSRYTQGLWDGGAIGLKVIHRRSTRPETTSKEAFLLLPLLLAPKVAVVLGHAAAPHAVTAANFAAPHLVSTTAALQAHVVGAGMSPQMVAVTNALHTRALAMAALAGGAAGGAAVAPALVSAPHVARAGGAGAAGAASSAASAAHKVLHLAEKGAEFVGAEAGKVAIGKLLDTPKAKELMERARDRGKEIAERAHLTRVAASGA